MIMYNYMRVVWMLKITVLVDNNTLIDRYLTGEPGFSLWVETGGKKILLDTGYSDVFIKNAQLLGLDVAALDMIVLSHGHNDHTWGLGHLVQHYDRRLIRRKPELLLHPEALCRKREDGLEIGMMLSKEILERYFVLTLSTEPVRITDRLTWLGEIPRTVEKEKAIGKRFDDMEEIDDFCHDDSALVYEAEKGLVIMTGCTHSGICNLIEHARRITGTMTIADIIGGFHMRRTPVETMDETIKWMSSNPPLLMHPCHCTDLQAKTALGVFFNIEEAGAGLELNYD